MFSVLQANDSTISTTFEVNKPPHIAIFGTSDEIAKILVIIDGISVPLNKPNIKTALDIVFKAFYVFNCKFPKELITFFNFMELAIYKNTAKKTSSAKILDLIKNIDGCEL